ncbi:MAG: Uma2 family endonuclease [Planctomycetota bacterium]|nr:Uma2 family endonuclease [Planctomycetota bacterium]
MSITLAQRPRTAATKAGVPPDLIWRLSVDQYHEMIRNGIIADDDPVELLEGWLVRKMGKNPPHRIATQLLREALQQAVPVGWFVDDQEAVSTGDSEPEPDVSVVRGDRRQYLHGHPQPKDVAIVVEVAESSLDSDETLKKRIYARGKIPAYWLVNLAERRIEVYSEPSAGRREPQYRQRREYAAGESVPVILDGKTVGRIAVRDVLP